MGRSSHARILFCMATYIIAFSWIVSMMAASSSLPIRYFTSYANASGRISGSQVSNLKPAHSESLYSNLSPLPALFIGNPASLYDMEKLRQIANLIYWDNLTSAGALPWFVPAPSFSSSISVSAVNTDPPLSTFKPTQLEIIGLPPGAPIPIRIMANNTNTTYNSVGYTTLIPIYVSPSTNSTYHGKLPYRWHGAMTEPYNGVNYTLLPSTYTLTLQVNKTNMLEFYVSLNSNLWNHNERSELISVLLSTIKIVIRSIQNQTFSEPYGSVLQSGNFLGAGTVKDNATDLNGSIVFNHIDIAKNQSYAYITLKSPLFNETITKPGSYHLPVAEVNNCWGITYCSPINVTLTISSHLLGNNTVPFNAFVKVGSDVLVNFSDKTSSLINQIFHFSLS